MKTIYDLKCVAPMTQYFQDGDLPDPTTSAARSPRPCHTFEGDTLEARARDVQKDYCRAAKTYDSKHKLGTTTYDRLISFRPVKGLVVGPRGEFSKDLRKLIKKDAASAAYKYWDSMGAKDVKIAKARYLRLVHQDAGRSCGSRTSCVHP